MEHAQGRGGGRRSGARALFGFIGAMLFAGHLGAVEPAARGTDGAAEAFARYTATQKDNGAWRQESVEIDASLPKLSKEGRLRAIRKLLPVGRPQYQVLELTGDQMVKREVIARYLSEDAQATQIPAASVAITPANYKFRFTASIRTGSVTVYIFTITPRKKRQGLIQGQLWLDGATGLAVRQSGYLVKRPSLFVKRIDFARETQLRDGVAELRITHLTIDTRLAGKAELTIQERPFETANSADLPEGTQQ